MIVVKSVYIGNENESYVQHGFTPGLNIITSIDNHVGKTILMQSIMYALGAKANFPASFKYRDYLFIVDIELNGRPISLLREKNNIVVKESNTIFPNETVKEFEEYWNRNFFELPKIVKDGSRRRVSLSLYTQMSFLPQSERSSARTTSGYYNKNDFNEMVFSIKNLDTRDVNTEEEKLKDKKRRLRTRQMELKKQTRALRKVGSSLSATSPTSDMEETNRLLTKLEKLRDEITEKKKKRNHANTRKMKNEAVLAELRSLDREIKVGSVMCMDCGSESIGYKPPNSHRPFDLTTSSIRKEIMDSVKSRIDLHEKEWVQLDREIHEKQREFGSLCRERNITLADVFAAREGVNDIDEADSELSTVKEEIARISKQLKTAEQTRNRITNSRSEFKSELMKSMNEVRHRINDEEDEKEYTELFTTNAESYSGSEQTEFLLARVYALAKHLDHQLPLVVDSFRAEELSTSREERALPLFEELENQVIFSATLKGQEADKYKKRSNINNIDFSGHTAGNLLSGRNNHVFKEKVAEFGIRLGF